MMVLSVVVVVYELCGSINLKRSVKSERLGEELKKFHD